MNLLLPDYFIKAAIVANIVLLVIAMIFTVKSKKSMATKILLTILSFAFPIIGSIVAITFTYPPKTNQQTNQHT